MTVASTVIDTGGVGDKLIRTSDGAYWQTAAGVVTQVAATDDFLSTPVGTKCTVTAIGPVVFTAVVPGKTNIAVPRRDVPLDATGTTVTGITTIATLIGGLTTFNTTYRTQ